MPSDAIVASPACSYLRSRAGLPTLTTPFGAQVELAPAAPRYRLRHQFVAARVEVEPVGGADQLDLAVVVVEVGVVAVGRGEPIPRVDVRPRSACVRSPVRRSRSAAASRASGPCGSTRSAGRPTRRARPRRPRSASSARPGPRTPAASRSCRCRRRLPARRLQALVVVVADHHDHQVRAVARPRSPASRRASRSSPAARDRSRSGPACDTRTSRGLELPLHVHAQARRQRVADHDHPELVLRAWACGSAWSSSRDGRGFGEPMRPARSAGSAISSRSPPGAASGSLPSARRDAVGEPRELQHVADRRERGQDPQRRPCGASRAAAPRTSASASGA